MTNNNQHQQNNDPRRRGPPHLARVLLSEERLCSNNGYLVIRESRYQGRPVAVKRSARRHDPTIEAELAHEAQILELLTPHPNIVHFIGSAVTQVGRIVVEELADLSLAELLRDLDYELTWRLRYKLALDVARGLAHMHERRVLHRDLKASNVLVFFGHTDDDSVAKLCDFGFSTLVSANRLTACDCLGTLEWTAPEVLASTDGSSERYVYSTAADVYSFGLLLWEIASRQIPFHTLDAVAVYTAVVRDHARPRIPDHTPVAFARLIEECWATNPQHRPSLAAIVERLGEMEGYESATSSTAMCL